MKNQKIQKNKGHQISLINLGGRSDGHALRCMMRLSQPRGKSGKHNGGSGLERGGKI